MHRLQRAQVEQAMAESPWDVTNEVLYSMCRRYPGHGSVGPVLAKVNLIGRAYAVAIERRKNRAHSEQNDSFYLVTVGPTIIRSDIDLWLAAARQVRPGTEHAFDVLLDVHARTTSLLAKISGMEKRSLASKYLHFHVPCLFFIYDSRAVKAIAALGHLIPRASRTSGAGDNEYRKFAEKCNHIVRHCSTEYGLRLNPRQLDNLLLRVSE